MNESVESGKELVNWEEKMAAEAQAVAATFRPSVSALSFRSGILSYMKQPVPGNNMDCVVVGAIFENSYYDKPFDPDNIVNPTCYAQSLDGSNMAPPLDWPTRQADSCIACPQFKWGSATRDGKPSKGKACKEKVKLGLIPVSVLTNGNITTAEIATATIPITSTPNWNNYVSRVVAATQRPYFGVTTNISVHPHIRNQIEVKFEPRELIDKKHFNDLFVKRKQVLEALFTPYDFNTPPEDPVGRDEPKDAKKRKY